MGLEFLGKKKHDPLDWFQNAQTEIGFALDRNFCHCKDGACVYYNEPIEKTQYVVIIFLYGDEIYGGFIHQVWNVVGKC